MENKDIAELIDIVGCIVSELRIANDRIVHNSKLIERLNQQVSGLLQTNSNLLLLQIDDGK